MPQIIWKTTFKLSINYFVRHLYLEIYKYFINKTMIKISFLILKDYSQLKQSLNKTTFINREPSKERSNIRNFTFLCRFINCKLAVQYQVGPARIFSVNCCAQTPCCRHPAVLVSKQEQNQSEETSLLGKSEICHFFACKTN